MKSAILITVAFINVIFGFIAIIEGNDYLSDVYYISLQIWLVAAILSIKEDS